MLFRAVLAIAVVVAGTVMTPAAQAAAPTGTVTERAAAWTPYVTSSGAYVRKLAQCGDTMYAVGTFTQVGAPGAGRLTRRNAFAFSATTGAIRSWNPNVNGTVQGIALSSDCATAYLAGTFTSVHGTAVKNLARVDAAAGAVDTAFKPVPDGAVDAVVLLGGHLIVGGTFGHVGGAGHRLLASLSPVTGRDDGYLDLGISGVIPHTGAQVYRLVPSHGGDRLLALGSFTSVAGSDRQQIFMVDLGPAKASLDAWYSPVFSESCVFYLAYYVRAATWSPDDSFVYTATTGRFGPSELCDSVAAFPATPTGDLDPLWVNKTGCDSLYSVAADDRNVYAGGHQRWMENEGACEKPNQGSVPRLGVASVDPQTGATTDWNPGRARGKGADDMLLTPAGLWIASDNTSGASNCAGAFHPGICFLPY